MNNYKEKILEILDKAYLERVLSSYFEDDRITNSSFRIGSYLLQGKFDPMYYTGMNVLIDHLVSKNKSFIELGYNVLSGDPFKSKFFGIGDKKLIRIRDIKRNYIDIEKATVIPENHFQSYPNAHAQLNDIIIGMDGDEFRAAIIKEEHLPCAINQRVSIIRGLDEELAIYYMLAINSYIGVYQLERVKTYAGTVGHISGGDVKNLRFPVDDSYKEFVKKYKEAVDNIGQFVDSIVDKSENFRKKVYQKLDLKPPKEIEELMKLEF